MARADDTELLARRFAEGDEAALEELLDRHLPRLRAFVRARVGPELRARESASDLVQSTCREILEHRERFRFPGHDAFRHWLFTTAARKVAERLERARTRKRDAGSTPGPSVESAAERSRLLDAYGRFSSPSHRAVVEDEVARVEAALDLLSEEQREVVLLAHLAELSRSEIAERLGKSEGAVRSILYRAMARVATALDAGG